MTKWVFAIYRDGLFGKPSEYLKSYDLDWMWPDRKGTGMCELTKNIDEAMEFDSMSAVMDAWKQQSKKMPYRSDGKPNRPLSAFTISPIPKTEGKQTKQ